MPHARSRVLLVAGLASAWVGACSSFDADDTQPAIEDGGTDSPSAVDGRSEGEAGGDASVACSPSLPPEGPKATCGTETDVEILNNPNHCGGCGHACVTCANGLCPVETVANVGGVELLLTPEAYILGESTGGEVWRAPRNGQAPVMLHSFGAGDNTQGLAMDGDHLFVGAYQGVYEFDLDAGTGKTVQTATDRRVGFGQTKDELFWGGFTSSLVFMQKDGGNVREYGKVATGAESTGVAADDKGVYWIRRHVDGGPLAEILVRTPDNSVKTRLDGLEDPASLVLDADYLYWVSGSRRELLRAPRAGTDRPTVIARWTDPVYTLSRGAVLGGSFVYWTLRHASDTGAFVILRAPKDCNGEVVTIAKGTFFTNLVVEGDHVYYGNSFKTFRVTR
ncbi:MAG: hypothetical protein JST00_39020 [Deltaproteobacteria bacterium]|nr:hypothetical protein [Deltaproteobacteria bacterium]